MFVSFLNVRIVVETNCDVKDNVRVDDVIKSVSVNIHQVSIHDANVRPSNLVSVNVYRVSLHPKMSSTCLWRSAVLDVQVASVRQHPSSLVQDEFYRSMHVNAVLKSVSINVSPVLNVMSIGSVTFFSSTSVVLCEEESIRVWCSSCSMLWLFVVRGVKEDVKGGMERDYVGIVRTWDRPYSGGGCVRE